MPILLDDNQFQQQQQQQHACASTQTGDESTTIASISECGCLNNSLSESSFGCSEAAAPTRTKAERKRQFALQFKTQACRAYVAGGMCPYAAKCYFAHGADDFRTPEQNDADGLVTDSAIRAWLRARAEAATNLSGALAGAVIATEQPSKNTSPSRLLEPIAKTSFHEPSIIEPASIRTPQEMAVCGADDSALFLTSHDGGDLLCGGASFESNSVDSESLLVRPSSAVAARFRYNPYSIYRVKVVM